MDREFLIEVAVKLALSVILGGFIGIERERHGRAAGMRTHILVCIGAALTSLISIYVNEYMGGTGDILRLSAQVISGIGFLGAGMIILRDNNVIVGLTTAAGVWTTSIIGIAIGYGFYAGAGIATVCLLISTMLFSKFERAKRKYESVYIEIDNMYMLNNIINILNEKFGDKMTSKVVPPKSNYGGNLGIVITVKSGYPFKLEELCDVEHVVYVEKNQLTIRM